MGKDAPKSDPRIGEAATLSAKTGAKYLDWMMGRATTTDEWASDDRERYTSTFVPLQNEYIAKAREWGSPERQTMEAAEARADVLRNAGMAKEQSRRVLTSMGVNPDTPGFAAMDRSIGIDTALAAAGAENVARRRVRAEGMDMLGNAVNLGSGMAINPLASYSAGTGAGSSGFSGAMQGYGQAGQLYNQQFQNEMQRWQASQGAAAGLSSGIGGLVGMAFASDPETKEDRKPARKVLDKVAAMPVEEWTYKPGKGDGKRHIGPMADEFAKVTGKGNGRQIDVIDAIGTTLAAVKELNAKVDRMAGKRRIAA